MTSRTLSLSAVFILFLTLPLTAAVVGEFEVYVGNYESSSQAEVIVSFTEGKLIPSYGPSVAEEIKETFNLKSLELITAPRIKTELGEKATVRTGPGTSAAVDTVELSFQPTSLKNGVVHMNVSFRLDDREPAGAEFTTALDKPVTLASRINGQIVFILCRVLDPAKREIGEIAPWDMPPTLLRKVSPVYPESMRKNASTDVVILELTIGIDGRVNHVKTLRGEFPEAVQAATEAAQQWTWEPARLDNQPIEATYVVTLSFRLD